MKRRTAGLDSSQAGKTSSLAVGSTAGDSRIAARRCRRVRRPLVAGGMAVPRGQRHPVHRDLVILGAAWVQHRDALLELRLGVRGHRGDVVQAGNLRG